MYNRQIKWCINYTLVKLLLRKQEEENEWQKGCGYRKAGRCSCSRHEALDSTSGTT